MQFLILGLAALVLFVLAASILRSANPASLAAALRRYGPIVLFIVAGLASALGRFVLAAPLAMLALYLLNSSGKKAPGQTSRVKTAFIEMELDHDSGEMRGQVLHGAFAGRALEALSEGELLALLNECQASDPQSVRLLEAYLDRVHPDWRQSRDGDGGASRESGPGAHGDGPMTPDKAYEILGLAPGASRDDIRAAHRRLMKKLHPDQGGSPYLASQINQAKDVLLGNG